MREKQKVIEDVKKHYDFPVYEKKMVYHPNGDVSEEDVQLTPSEIEERAMIGIDADSFLDAVNRVPDVSTIDKFEAIDRLNAAIANIRYEPRQLNPVTNEEK